MVAIKRDPRVSVSRAYAQTKRTMRNPRHSFQLRVQPFQIQPFMLAPVLPGETMKNLLLQARVVTDPIVHPLIGWWTGFYFFYVPLIYTDLKADVLAMFESNTAMPSADGADVRYHHWANGINWTKECMKPVVRHFFRDEGEDWDVATLDTLPLAQIKGESWMDSLTLDANYVNRDVDLDLDADGNVEASEVTRGIDHWQALRDAGLMDMDYEDFLRTYGVKGAVREETATDEIQKPELIRYAENWSYPTNTVDPSNGTPRSAVSWSVAERADKDRFFKHPGFILGITCTRAKMYMGLQTGQLAHALNTQLEWLPAVLHDHPELSRINFADGTGPVDFTDVGGYWVDVKDLYMHGDQFLNYAIDSSSNKLSLPVAATAQRRYPLQADIEALFVDAAGGKKYVRMDGAVSLGVLGRQREVTPNTSM